jgi:hypothetical protein
MCSTTTITGFRWTLQYWLDQKAFFKIGKSHQLFENGLHVKVQDKIVAMHAQARYAVLI